ncbi:hypothetical protein [Cellulomonas sp. PhB143]|uniref:hypothetical protein n=1 Tax=Cellulomonas sp. PhB143 TaxID=2485186 RepID=UPI000F9E9341|nr:hypothetical protein [Cellulomonas sp. PhB143]ROS76933.1 hypothetical protein EDF32_0919 [Cellulomonas sp. PhB143]
MTGRTPHRARRTLLAVTGVVAAGALAIGGVVVGLKVLDDRRPVTERCTAAVDGTSADLTPQQADVAALVAVTAERRGMPARAATIGLATASAESHLRNLDHGDRDSLGIFQQRPSQGWGTEAEVTDPVHATNAFYDALEDVDGYTRMRVTEAAQAVQRSAFPEGYAPHATRSGIWASALTGWSPAALTCTLRDVAQPAPAPDAVAELEGRVVRDLGDLPTRTAGVGAAPQGRAGVEVDARGLGGTDPGDASAAARSAWSVAQWAVATASTTDAVAVAVDGQVWTRESAAWSRPDEDDDGPAGAGPPPAPGRVAVTVATS